MNARGRPVSEPGYPQAGVRTHGHLSLAFVVGGPALSAVAAGFILAAAPQLGHEHPQDAFRLLLRTSALVSAAIFVATLLVGRQRDALLLRAGYRGVLGSQLVHLLGLVLGGYLWSPSKMETVTSQNHLAFALLPGSATIVLGLLAYAGLALLAAKLDRLSRRVRIVGEVSMWLTFTTIYLDALVSGAGEGLAGTLAYGVIVMALFLAGSFRVIGAPRE